MRSQSQRISGLCEIKCIKIERSINYVYISWTANVIFFLVEQRTSNNYKKGDKRVPCLEKQTKPTSYVNYSIESSIILLEFISLFLPIDNVPLLIIIIISSLILSCVSRSHDINPIFFPNNQFHLVYLRKSEIHNIYFRAQRSIRTIR